MVDLFHIVYEKDTKGTDKERLKEAIDALTEENQRHFLGVVEALAFAQTEQSKEDEEEDKAAPVYPA
jgi:ABC-type phosphate/phosphonate transport system substrate-binding protein